MNEFIEIHLCPKGEAMIIRKSAVESLWEAPNGGCLICQSNRVKLIEVTDSYEDLRKMLIGEGKA